MTIKHDLSPNILGYYTHRHSSFIDVLFFSSGSVRERWEKNNSESNLYSLIVKYVMLRENLSTVLGMDFASSFRKTLLALSSGELKKT